MNIKIEIIRWTRLNVKMLQIEYMNIRTVKQILYLHASIADKLNNIGLRWTRLA